MADITEDNENTRGPERILVVGKEDAFSQKLVEYAVWFAKRMDYELVALSCVPFGREAPKVLSPYREELEKEFKFEAAKGVELMAYRSSTEGVDFRHIVKFGSPDRCIREVHEEIEGIEFVITEPEACPEVHMEAGIPVFAYHT